MFTLKKETKELLKEKGHLSVASLTLSEFNDFIDQKMRGVQESMKAAEKVIIETRVNPLEEKLLNQKEICEILNVSAGTFATMKSEGRIPEYLVGSTLKYNVKEVKEALKIRTPENVSDLYR